jgi:hypothetical protein
MIMNIPNREGRSALGAYGLILQPVPGYAIFCGAIGAWNDNAVLIHPFPFLTMTSMKSRVPETETARSLV